MKDETVYLIELDGTLQEPHFESYDKAYNRIEELFSDTELAYKEGRIIQCRFKDMNVIIRNKKK